MRSDAPFSGMAQNGGRCRSEDLEAFACRVLVALGADDDIAREVAGHLILANLSGHDSHGVMQLLRYAAEVESGQLHPELRPFLEREADVVAVVDGRRGFGHYSTRFALDWCVDRARTRGLAVAAVRHSMHIGRLGHYVERAAAQGMVAIVTVGSAGPDGGFVAPFGGIGRFLGTNPWAIGFPAHGRPPMIFDAATSSIAEGKVRMALDKKLPVPVGTVRDSDGVPTADPSKLYEGGSLTGLGGDVAGHKGYGFALAAALLGGLAMIDDPEPTPAGTAFSPPHWQGRIAGVVVLTLNPGWFGNPEQYSILVANVLSAANSVPAAEGRDRVLVPGEPELLMREQRSTEGIAIPKRTWKELEELAQRFHLALPNRVSEE